MERLYIPIMKFYQFCLPSAREHGYKYVVSLLARDAGLDMLYPTLERQWAALDDVTAKDFLFVFVGDHEDNDWNSPLFKNNQLYNAQIHPFDKIPLAEKCNYEYDNIRTRAHFSPGLPQKQTRNIYDLQNYFGLSRRDIPCLMFTNLYAETNTRVSITDYNLYGLLDSILIDLEELFVYANNLILELDRYKQIQKSGIIKDMIDCATARDKLLELCKSLKPEPRNELLRCLDTCEFDKDAINPYFHDDLKTCVTLSKRISALSESDLRNIELVTSGVEPARTKSSLDKIWIDADRVIASYNR